MGNIQFEDESFGTKSHFQSQGGGFGQPKMPFMVGIVIKMGLAKEEKGANTILTSFSVVLLIASAVIFKVYVF